MKLQPGNTRGKRYTFNDNASIIFFMYAEIVQEFSRAMIYLERIPRTTQHFRNKGDFISPDWGQG
jgi:hypothetical protein